MATLVTVPDAPSNVVAHRDSDSSATITWKRNPSSNAPYNNQFLSRWDNVSNDWTDEKALAGTDASQGWGIGANRRYRFRVRAKNSVGYSNFGYSDFIQTTPAAPAGAVVDWTSPTSVNVRWVNGAGGGGYDYATEVESSLNGGPWGTSAIVGAGSTSQAFSGLTPGSVWQFRVRHTSTVGATTYSGYSTSGAVLLEAAPSAPSGFTATRNSDTSMSLAWTNNPSTVGPYTTLTLQRNENGGPWVTVAELAPTTVNFTDTSAVPDRKYQYQIRASNRGGSSAWTSSPYLFTTPAAPGAPRALYTAGNAITVSWRNLASYAEYTLRVQPVKNGVAGTTVTLAGGTTSYALTGADPFSTYTFNVWAVSNTGALNSAVAVSNSVMGSAAPAAPVNVHVLPSEPVDFNDPRLALTWTHSPSQDGSAMTKYQYQYRQASPAAVKPWTTSDIITGTDPTRLAPWPVGTFANGTTVEFQVRTWGVHTDPSPWSATGTATGSDTPTLSLNAPGAIADTSKITVNWDFFQKQGSPQAEWQFTITDTTTGALIESRQGADASHVIDVAAPAEQDHQYRLDLSARAANGMWTAVTTRLFVAKFVPPAEAILTADLDSESGAVVLSLTPAPDDGGKTTRSIVNVNIERQIYDPETETYGDWELIAEGVDPNATLIDTTAPIYGDGYYRATSFSNAPSSWVPAHNTPPSRIEKNWTYLSAGPNFDIVAKMWANVQVSWKSSRSKALHYFAGRKRPVIYSGESAEKVATITGVITDDASQPQRWIYLAQQEGPVLFRTPGEPHIYGSLSEVSIDRIPGTNLSTVSFSVQEVYRP